MSSPAKPAGPSRLRPEAWRLMACGPWSGHRARRCATVPLCAPNVIARKLPCRVALLRDASISIEGHAIRWKESSAAGLAERGRARRGGPVARDLGLGVLHDACHRAGVLVLR